MSAIKLLCLLFTAHGYGVSCVYLCHCVNLCTCTISIMYGRLTNHALCENVGMYSVCVYACTCGISHTLLVVYV